MSDDQGIINCPECGEEIDVGQILHSKVDGELKKKYEDQLAAEKETIEEQQAVIAAREQSLKEQEEQQKKTVDEQVAKLLKKRSDKVRDEIKKEAEEEQKDAIDALQKQLDEKSDKVKEFNRVSVEFESLKREKNELEEKYKINAQKQINETLSVEREKISQQEKDRNELKLRELEKQLDDQKKLTEEMKRKQEQGSMQTQGEVQELVIEEWLASQFPEDQISEIKKGQRGADCLQVVNTQQRLNCGTIYYESKRTNNWQNAWIEKFKADIREQNASVGVLVTQAMPPGFDHAGFLDGVLVCSFAELKILASVLRKSVVEVSTATGIQENKGDKKELLYNLVTSKEFHGRVEAVAESFKQLVTQLESEKRALQTQWKKREKLLNQGFGSMAELFGSVQGIAGPAVMDIPSLGFEDDMEEGEREEGEAF